ncbi:flavin reductase family protein [Bradyrhizobium sp. SYSU BS000235]|uniref:flavin reductase family protein n=1 Tax=Bradyrhizobium sp. SYSU BS000235 TaxID=3411332 RepID=UPI003C766FBF
MNSMVRNIEKATTTPTVSAESFRGAMRHLAGGVSVITAGQGPDISGMTVTSVTSLAVEPATLVVSVNRQSSSWPRISELGAFGVNILGADHAEIAKRFSGVGGLKGAARFEGAEWATLVTGVPLLSGAPVALDCEVEHVVERHSHMLVIGRVLDVLVSDGKGGLSYWQGQYIPHHPGKDASNVAGEDVPTARALWGV